jgi:predicted site-specific integrase-resolvase
MADTDILKVEDISKMFRVSYWTVLRWARDGKFGAFKMGKSWYFLQSRVEEELQENSRAVHG